MRGSRKDYAAERLLPFAAQGVAVASASYRLVDVASHPAQLEDARAAVRWLRENGRDHGLRTSHIGSWGASAGAWIALMLLLTGDDMSARADATAAWFPITNLATVAAERDAAGLPMPSFIPPGRPLPSMEAGLLGLSSLSDDLELAADASPLSHAADANGPALLIHGDTDGLVSATQSLSLHNALLGAGRDSQLMLLAGANHEDPGFDKPAVLAATAGFFSAQL